MPKEKPKDKGPKVKSVGWETVQTGTPKVSEKAKKAARQRGVRHGK